MMYVQHALRRIRFVKYGFHRRTVCLVVTGVLMALAYQLTLGKGSIIDKHLDATHRADTFVQEHLQSIAAAPQQLDGVHLSADAASLKNGSYNEAVARVAQSFQLADDHEWSKLANQSSVFSLQQGALTRNQLDKLLATYGATQDKHELERMLAAFLSARGAVLAPLPTGLSRSEVYSLAVGLTLQIGSLPATAIQNSVNGGTLRIAIVDDGSIQNEFYTQGATAGSTYRQNDQTAIQLHYVPKRDYPTLGIAFFRGTIAHELAHALNLDTAATQSTYVTTANAQRFSSPNTLSSVVRSAGLQRFAGTPQYESMYAQSDPLEDVAETTRAILTGDIYMPDQVRSFESPLGIKKLQVLAELEYRFPGMTAYVLTR